MKKLLCLFLLCLVASTARADTYVSGDYEYEMPDYFDYAVEITRYTGDATEVVIPDELDGRPVAYISSHIFHENVNAATITSITIPAGVTVDFYVGNPFADCSSLTTINIASEDPVLEIVDGALINKMERSLICYPRGLSNTSYSIPEGIEVIRDDAFAKCRTLMSITLPDSVKTIRSGAFEECRGLTSITLPDSVEIIGVNAFRDCTGLTSVALPDSVKEIGRGAFKGCSKLCSINIPDGVTTISNSSFKDCYNLSNIRIPNGVTVIEDYAFYGCDNLGKVFIPASVKSIEEHAFEDVRYSFFWPDYIEGCTLVVVRNSYAENYARSNGIPFTYAAQEALQQVGATACPYCYGGWRDCTVCGTFGQCTSCQGAGYRSRYTRNGYEYYDCGVCRGTGACSRCGYSGFIQCSVCGGTGIID